MWVHGSPLDLYWLSFDDVGWDCDMYFTVENDWVRFEKSIKSPWATCLVVSLDSVVCRGSTFWVNAPGDTNPECVGASLWVGPVGNVCKCVGVMLLLLNCKRLPVCWLVRFTSGWLPDCCRLCFRVLLCAASSGSVEYGLVASRSELIGAVGGCCMLRCNNSTWLRSWLISLLLLIPETSQTVVLLRRLLGV